MIDKNLPQLLDSISDLLKKHQEIEDKKKENFNIFNVMRVETNEVNTHSAIISELLNPKGSHQFGDKFLRVFLQQIADIAPALENEDLTKTKVSYEKSIGEISEDKTEGGRIDILIEHPEFKICIENKINAGDQPFQLRRYHNFLSQTNKKTFLLYLTPYGEKADASSICSTKKEGNKWVADYETQLKPKKDYHCISYGNEIMLWLEECAKISRNNNVSLNKILEQYISIINQLTTMMNIDEEKELMKVMEESRDLSAAKYIFEHWGFICYVTEQKFWLGLLDVIEKKYSIEKWECLEKINQQLDKKGTRELNFVISKLDEYHNIGISIQQGTESSFCYGIALFDSNNNVINDTEKSDKLYEIIYSLDKNFKRKDALVSCKDFQEDINFAKMNDVALKLVDPDYRSETIQKLWNEIEAFIARFLQEISK